MGGWGAGCPRGGLKRGPEISASAPRIGISARFPTVIREAVECGREEDGEADRWGWLPVGERALDGLARCVVGWSACASENAAGFRGWKRAGALRGWSECVRAGRGEEGAHAGPLRARRTECVRVGVGPRERERGSRPGWAACWGGKEGWAERRVWAGLGFGFGSSFLFPFLIAISI